MDPHQNSSIKHSLSQIQARISQHFKPKVGVVLGSGLGAFADTLKSCIKIPYVEIGFPSASVAGHAGMLCVGTLGSQNVNVACLQGRVHGYEGHSADQVVFAVRTLAQWGCSVFVLTNAAGGVNRVFEPGDLMLISDHINLMGWNPLSGPNDPSVGPRFLDMTQAYDLGLRTQMQTIARAQNIVLREGVYCALPGPSYETPAEIRMLQTLGADAVGMSTVPEVLALRHRGVRCVAMSCITNKGAGIGGAPLSHHEVQEVADHVKNTMICILSAFISEQI